MAILGLVEWCYIYDATTRSLTPITTLDLKIISEKLFKSLRLCFTWAAATAMDSYATAMQKKGIEYLNKVMAIFHSKWTHTDHPHKKSFSSNSSVTQSPMS